MTVSRAAGAGAGALGGNPFAPRVVIIGAGIAGLAAALRITREAPQLEVVICEASSRPGGIIATERGGERGEYLIEAGPDSFLTEKPEALRLFEQLGLAGRLVGVQAAAAHTYVVHRGRLTPAPDGFRIFAPTRLWPWLRSPLFSWPGKVRTGMDWILPRGRPVADESVVSFVTRRLGREVFDRIAEPMIGTIYTADAARLSLAATMPRFLDLERRYGSVIRGLIQAQRATAGAPAPDTGPAVAPAASGRRFGLFAAPSDGMQILIDEAVKRLPAGALRLSTSAVSLMPVPRYGTRGYEVTTSAGDRLEAAAVVVAAPAPAAARVLAGMDHALAAGLSAIAYASSASVTLAYRRSEVPHRLDGVGCVVPKVERRAILAASFSSVKFPGRAPADRVLLRVFLGGMLAPEALDVDDAGLVAAARREVDALLGTAAAPQLARVHRHDAAMPQYVVGHLARVAEIEARLAAYPGVALAGAAYRGVGIPDCIRSGEGAADVVLAHVQARSLSPGVPS
jgi:protoporphyrinogen/coproporphyrinogen III oxidase